MRRLLLLILMCWPLLFSGTICNVVVGGVASSSWTISDDFSSDTSADYTAIGPTQGTITIASGVARGSTYALNYFYHETTLGSADQIVEGDISFSDNGNDSGGILCRVNPTNGTGYLVRFAATSIGLFYFDSSAATAVQYYDGGYNTDAITGTGTYHVVVTCSGSSFTVEVDGATAISGFTDTHYSTGDYCGIAMQRGQNNADVIVSAVQGVAN